MAGDDALKPSSSGHSLNFGNPLYLHSNDTGGSPIVTVKLTGTKNYKVWSIAMTFSLRNHNKIGFIDGSCKKNDYDASLANQFFNLHKNINSLTQSGYSLAEYYNNLNSLWKQFDAMISLPACTCEVAEHYEKHNQLIKLMQFLMGLDDNYLAIRSNILTREPLPLVKAAFAIVSGEESHRNITSNGANKPVATVFAAKFVNKKKANNNNNYNKGSNSNSRGPNPNLKYTNCNKIGHTVDRCFEIVGYPAGYVKKNFIPNSRPVISNNTTVDPQSNNVNSNATSKSPVSLSNEQLTRLMNLLNENGVFSTNANMSGANQHMTVSAKNLINMVDISNLCLIVGLPSGTQALITKIRDLKLNNKITLYDVLVVPEYTVSLLSVHKLSRDNKLTLWHQRLGHPANPVLDVLKGSLTLDSKDDVYDSIVSFAQMINNQFETNVKTFRSDNGSEFVNNKLQRFFNEKDPKRPNDEGRVSSNDDGSELSPDNNNQGNDDSDATSMEETNNTHPEGNIKGKVKYGVERVVNYANLKPDSFCFVTALNESIEPSCYEEVVLDRNWIDAMYFEIEALNDNQTWVITDLPPRRKAIGNKWIYKIKYKSSGDIDRYKARLVVKGCSKKEGVDFDETFSPVVKMSTVRCLIALSVTNNWPLF
ncbi:ribonuclease H-like domain-containing protein [Tanacetum coccineum]